MDISIIIPVYNVEKYIRKCILSVIEQKWGNLEYEVLVVNDETPDNSMQIVEELKHSYKEVITVINQRNKGLGGARNTGIQNAKGKYVFFLDSDDFLINDEMPNLCRTVIDANLDILEFSAERVDENYNTIDIVFKVETNIVLNSAEYLSTVKFANSACNKLYRLDFLRKENITFFERTYIEDAPFNIEAISKARRIMAVNKVPVAYLQNPTSITREKKTVNRQIKFIEDSLKVISRMNEYAFYHNEKAHKGITSRVATFVSGTILMIIKSDISKNEKKSYIKQLEDKNLYPYHYKSNIRIRDFFMTIVNKRLLLNLILIMKR